MLLIVADRCPHCDFAAILDPQDKVMSCQNSSCQKVDSSYCAILSNSRSAARSMECSKCIFMCIEKCTVALSTGDVPALQGGLGGALRQTVQGNRETGRNATQA